MFLRICYPSTWLSCCAPVLFNVDSVSITDLTINADNVENGIKGDDCYDYKFSVSVYCVHLQM